MTTYTDLFEKGGITYIGFRDKDMPLLDNGNRLEYRTMVPLAALKTAIEWLEDKKYLVVGIKEDQ